MGIKALKVVETVKQGETRITVTVKYDPGRGDEMTVQSNDAPRAEMMPALNGLIPILVAEECWDADYLGVRAEVYIAGVRVTKDDLLMIDYHLTLPSGTVTRVSPKFSPESLSDEDGAAVLRVWLEAELYVKGDREQMRLGLNDDEA